jgi:hypothetical protein
MGHTQHLGVGQEAQGKTDCFWPIPECVEDEGLPPMPNHYHFTGQLTARDCKRHLAHRFVLEPTATALTITFHFTPHRVNGMTNLLTLTLFDPAGCRGAGHRGGAAHTVTITPDGATPGYRAGSLPPGEWIAQIDTHMIMPGEPVQYTLEITTAVLAEVPLTPSSLHPFTLAPLVLSAAAGRPSPPAPPGPGWYRGDLHSHTEHSDADRSVADLLTAAQAVGLDFICLTDHNTVSGLAELHTASTGLLTIGGIELTTFWGHALRLGTHEWVDWRMRPGTGAITQMADASAVAGHLFIIAHPLAVGDPACTGCAWRYPEMMPGNARFVEIWNGPWGCDSNNELALAFWYDWLNQGLRLVATAGSDTHSNDDYATRPGFTVIYAETLSEAGLFAGLRRGHVYLSSGPHLHLVAQTADGATWQIGATVVHPATFTLTWAACPADAQIQIVVSGRRFAQWACGVAGEQQWALTPAEADWCTVEIRDAAGELLAITNPIFLTDPFREE